MENNPKRLPDVRLRKIFSRYILSKVYVTMETNELGSRIWLLCNGTQSKDEIAQTIVREYDVDIETARQDCNEFLRDLEANKMISWTA